MAVATWAKLAMGFTHLEKKGIIIRYMYKQSMRISGVSTYDTIATGQRRGVHNTHMELNKYTI